MDDEAGRLLDRVAAEVPVPPAPVGRVLDTARRRRRRQLATVAVVLLLVALLALRALVQ